MIELRPRAGWAREWSKEHMEWYSKFRTPFPWEEKGAAEVFAIESDGKKVVIGGNKDRWTQNQEGAWEYAPLNTQDRKQTILIPEGTVAHITLLDKNQEWRFVCAVGAENLKTLPDWTVLGITLQPKKTEWIEIPPNQWLSFGTPPEDPSERR